MKNSKPAYRRHDISDETWALLEPHLPGRKGVWSSIAEDNRRFIRWRDKGIWEKLLEVLIDEPQSPSSST
jgi:transposase